MDAINDSIHNTNHRFPDKIAHHFLEIKLDKTPIEWDSKKKELKIDLNKFTELNTFLEFVTISELQFIKDTIVLEMYTRGKK